jgi:hypothetical protein
MSVSVRCIASRLGKIKRVHLITDINSNGAYGGHRKSKNRRTHDVVVRRAPPWLSAVECVGTAAILFRFAAARNDFLVINISSALFNIIFR